MINYNTSYLYLLIGFILGLKDVYISSTYSDYFKQLQKTPKLVILYLLLSSIFWFPAIIISIGEMLTGKEDE